MTTVPPVDPIAQLAAVAGRIAADSADLTAAVATLVPPVPVPPPVPPPTPPPSPAPIPTDLAQMVKEGLLSQSTAGWDSTANGGKGGVKVNWWLDGHTPSQNTGHDAGEDLRFIEALTLYKAAFPSDTSLDAAIAKFEPVATSLFQTQGFDKSWAWKALVELGWWDAAYHTAKFWVSQIVASAGVALQPAGVPSSTGNNAPKTPGPSYRVDAAMQIGAGLIVVGGHFNDTAMVAAGNRMIDVAVKQASAGTYGLYGRMVVVQSGKATLWDVQCKSGEALQSAFFLILAGRPEGKALFDAMKASPLRDQVNGGFLFKFPDVTTGVLDPKITEKEQGRCMVGARAAFALGDLALRDELMETSRKSFQKATTAGWPYRTTPTFGLFGSPPEAWATSESGNLNAEAILTSF